MALSNAKKGIVDDHGVELTPENVRRNAICNYITYTIDYSLINPQSTNRIGMRTMPPILGCSVM